MKRRTAEVLAKWDRNWTARQSRHDKNHWFVWSKDSHHEVEFDDGTIAAVEKEDTSYYGPENFGGGR